VLNLQLIPEDERDTDAAATACQEAASAAAAAAAASAASCIARSDYLTVPEEPSPEQLISLLHRYPEAAAAACAERMRRPHNLQIFGQQSHPFIGQFISAARPPIYSSGGPHIPLETTSPLPSPDPPLSPVSTPSPPPVPPPALAPPQIRMLPVPLPPRPVAAQRATFEPVSASTTRYRHGMPYYPEA
jgi:hypothetical protein